MLCRASPCLEKQSSILEITESAASLLNPSVTCAACSYAMHDRGWFGARRSVSADFEV